MGTFHFKISGNIEDNLENLKQMSGKISAQLRRPKFVRKILCCVALVYNSHTFLQTAVD